MKTNTSTPSKRSGFTLIEMIGVLAIIAVLAALLIPRIFTAINESRVNGAALSYNSVKSAAMSYFGKYGRFGNAAGAAITLPADAAVANAWDQVLLSAGFTEKPFETKIAATSSVKLVAAIAGTEQVDATNAAYDLDGAGLTIDPDGVGPLTAGPSNDAVGQYVIQAVLTGVAIDDAVELSRKIDGENLSQAAGTQTADLAGRVKYDAAVGGVTAVYLYIAHK